jgi:hypothetical protein
MVRPAARHMPVTTSPARPVHPSSRTDRARARAPHRALAGLGLLLTLGCAGRPRDRAAPRPGAGTVVLGGGATAADVAGVRAALAHYLAGHATGHPDSLRAAFHPRAQMVVLRDGAVRAVPIAEYIAGFSGAPAADEPRRRRRVAAIEITGTAAVARLELDYPAVHHTDYMTLLREGDRWWIVGKTAHSVRRPLPVTRPAAR